MASRLTDEERKLREMSERDLDSHIRKLTDLYHWRRYHTFRADRSPAGFPDLCLVRPPHLIFAELKREEGKPTPLQIEWLDDLARAGQHVFLWMPRDLATGDIPRLLLDPASPSISRWRAVEVTPTKG